MRTRIAHTLLFLAGLFGTAQWIRSFESLPFWSWSRDKLSYYTANADQYDTLLLGSSRVHFGIVPAVFDARMKELGAPTRTFNMALSGLRPHDVDVILDWVLEHRSPNLRRVCIELHSWGQAGRWESWMTDMQVEMHPLSHWWTRTWSALRDSVVDTTDRARVLNSIATHTLVNAFRVGRAPAILDCWIASLRGSRQETRKSFRGEGFVPVSVAASPEHRKEHEAWLAAPQQFERGALRVRQGDSLRLAPGSFDLESTRRQVRRVRAAGLEVVFLVMPSLAVDFHGRDQVAEIDPEVRLVELDRPEVCEPVLRPEFWYDHAHVTQEGAELLSRSFADLLRGPRQAPYRPTPRIVVPPAPVAAPRQVPPEPVAPPPAATQAPVAELLPSLRASAAWNGDGLDLRVESVPEGDVLAVVSAAPADLDLGNGIRARVALPALTYQILTREGAGARGRIAAAKVTADSPLYVQFAVIRGGVWIAVSDRIDLAARR